jgi:hypothetical protein
VKFIMKRIAADTIEANIGTRPNLEKLVPAERERHEPCRRHESSHSPFKQVGPSWIRSGDCYQRSGDLETKKGVVR